MGGIWPIVNQFGVVNEIYAARLGEHRPARATVGVTSLPRSAKIEIDCIAVRSRS